GSNSSGHPYPTLVVEVGNSESVSSLHDLSTGYFSLRTTIQIYLAIKWFPIRQDGTRAMLALRYLCTNQINTVPDIIISFGTAPLHLSTIGFLMSIGVPLANIVGVRFSAIACNASGIPIYQLHIPAIELFNGAFGSVTAGVVNGFYLDLWEIQDLVLNGF
ncbi:4720_t:CDS:1, partial [Paraglomus occultum]